MAANIQEYVAERGITHLVHFTREANLSSILNRGLLCRDHLIAGTDAVFNDEHRLDGTLATCLSISSPNYKMFYQLRKNNPEEKWVVIGVQPSVLWTLPCAFCVTNAAAGAVTALPIDQRKGLAAFQRMFEDWSDKTRASLGIDAQYPTNPQAEVLVFSPIPIQYLMGVAVHDAAAQQRLRSIHEGTAITLVPSFFNGRSDHAHWKQVI
ncbi:DUF4433 domain-containing protein [Xanthomonas campestris]|uniref:DarT ssDNA thymidine ADP-ribosyltransferase family protein n=1 Tax=Xanthomonas TaxID=338 RepID=UPI000B2FFE02|nr:MULTISPECIES: DarT ssDNA thymidine ADP-ribosyltransferase family protein [Xanthomonas]WDJ03214.1 DUF4433 domain-containing protein [Xanthomonas campestris]